MTDTKSGRFFLPGPTEVHADVLAAMARPMLPHRGRDMSELLRGMEQPLKDIFRTEQPVFFGTCSATGFMEMAVRGGVKHKMLALVGGAFGARFAAIGETCGREVVRLEVAPGRTIEPDMLRDALRRFGVDAVTLVHSETATGALAPLEQLAEAVREFPGVMLLVDAVTSIGGLPVETDAWQLDFVFTGSQKALALPPGLAFGSASERLVERAGLISERGAYLDLVTHVEAFGNQQPAYTPAIPLVFALDRQLQRIAEEGGIEARWRRHADMADTVDEWVDGEGGALGFDFLPPEGRRSWTVSCLTVPVSRNARAIVLALRELGWTIGSGYGPLKESTIRIGHMGDHSVERLKELLTLIQDVLD